MSYKYFHFLEHAVTYILILSEFEIIGNIICHEKRQKGTLKNKGII
jgi:hypothetical protein